MADPWDTKSGRRWMQRIRDEDMSFLMQLSVGSQCGEGGGYADPSRLWRLDTAVDGGWMKHLSMDDLSSLDGSGSELRICTQTKDLILMFYIF